MTTIPKVTRDGKVAVIVSPGFGAGWSTWANNAERAAFSPEVVEWIEGGKVGTPDLPPDLADEYDGGLPEAEIEWLDVGTAFYIREYDGSESLVVFGTDGWVA